MGGPATGLKIIGNRFVTNRNLFYIADSYNYYQGLSGDPVISGNFFELLPGRANTTTLTNGAGSSLRVSLASIAIQDAEVTISFATQGGASYPRGTTIVVEGVTGASGVNGSYRVLRCTSVVGGMTSITYQSSVSGQPQLSNAKVTLPVLVGARFSGNTWIGGVWRGSKLPGQDMLSASHGTSGSEPITYAGLNDGCTIEFANEPSGLE